MVSEAGGVLDAISDPVYSQMSRVSVQGTECMSMKSSSSHAMASGTTTVAGATSNLITVMIGVGILAFPKLFANLGWYVAPPMLCGIAFVTAEMAFLTNRCLDFVESLALSNRYSFGSKALTFENIGEACFGRPGKICVTVLSNSFLIFVSSAYLILIGINMEVFSMRTPWQMPTRAWVLVVVAFLAPTALMKDISKISRFASVGVFASVAYVAIIVSSGLYAAWFEDATAHPREFTNYTTEFSTLGQGSAMMLFGFMYVFVLPTVRMSMAQPSEMPKCISFATYAAVSIYLLCGLVGCYGWGIAVKGNVVQSMPASFGKAMSVSVVINLAVSYPIVMNCTCVAMETLFQTGYSVLLRLTMVLLTVVTCLSCPYFMAVVGLGSSVLGIMLGVFAPVVFFWRLCFLSLGSWAACVEQERLSSVMKHSFLVLFGVFTMFFGMKSSVADLQDALRDGSANPFKDFFRYMC